ncbi:AAA family ATPase [Microcoleus sp. FACHB-1515]|uniref:AAA family ATPase n=1 Tax=Cyanophyceae TaxID=3028117 RepID=UPI001685601D|nr:AAA family ATPase [Microcoleus sp. FACHB-1515]MBD2091797.1 AAA family ATPase [Microcoleus sp. FACHB-1515]
MVSIDSHAASPLAARMRPRTLDEFVGQDAILGQGRLLRRAIQADQLSSIIFYGPPGTGKTTLAQIIANTTRAHFIAINAVLDGVKEIRAAVASPPGATAQTKQQSKQKTILFVDEVHRFNKAQQDALLPWVENGTVILIGATTENPYFEVNKALVSRSRLFQLKPLTETDLRSIVQQALTDGDRGYGKLNVQIDLDAIDHLVNVANGDARALLNALELAVETTPPNDAGEIHISLSVAEESIQQRAVLYDKEGDVHFDTISAFIKSVRGSDADAALYWLARMVYAGEDPRFLFRRMLILASEDVGLADPQAVVVVNACAMAFDRVGLPEGRYPLAQAALYLATAPKSNSVMGFFDALAAVEQEREAEVPNPLRDAKRDREGFGHGAGYLYPHAYRDHWVAQQYLPNALQGQVFYQPSSQGDELQIQTQVARQREAQLAAMVAGSAIAPPEILTNSPVNRSQDRWLERTISQTATQLATVRDRLFAAAAPQRHHLLLDLNASSGLLVWEAVRQVPEGGVYARVRTPVEAEALQEQAIALAELSRPIVVTSSLIELSTPLPELRFDRILGHNALIAEPNKAEILRSIATLLAADGVLLLGETVPRHTQRLYQLVESDRFPADFYQRWIAAEETIYQNAADPMTNWDAVDLQAAAEQAGLRATVQLEPTQTQMLLTPALLDRWFRPGKDRPSYGDRLAQHLKPSEVAAIEQALTRLASQQVHWRGAIAYLRAEL